MDGKVQLIYLKGGDKMELTKRDSTMIKGLAALLVVAVHLFMRTGSDVYGTPLIWVSDDVPLIWYLGYIGEMSISLFCMCTGYALFLQFSTVDGKTYRKKGGKRLIRFLCHYWVVVILFTVIGFFFDASHEIPGSFLKFICNFFLLEETYNGAWWFVSTYVLFVLMSPLILKLVQKWNSKVVFVVFAGIFVTYYLCKVLWGFEAEPYYWKGFFYKKISDLWHVLFFYVEGMILAKERVISRIRCWMEKKNIGNGLVVLTILIVALISCIVRKTIFEVLLGIFYFVFFHLWKKPDKVEKFFFFCGTHSTNIWLVHMFFYLFIFKDLVFIAKYPILIYCFMLSLCILSSWVIGKIIKILGKCKLLPT